MRSSSRVTPFTSMKAGRSGRCPSGSLRRKARSNRESPWVTSRRISVGTRRGPLSALSAAYLPLPVLSAVRTAAACFQKRDAVYPLPGSLIGRLGIHIDEELPLAHRHQVIACLAASHGGLGMVLQKDGGSRSEELPASSRIFYMTDGILPIDLHVGDKAVGAA